MRSETEPLCRIRDILRSINDFEAVFHAQHGVKLNEGMLLCTLHKMKECSSGQIAEFLGLSASNSSKVIASAEKKGLIERAVGSDDKRQMFFRLTGSGEKCIDKIHCFADEMTALIEKIGTM